MGYNSDLPDDRGGIVVCRVLRDIARQGEKGGHYPREVSREYQSVCLPCGMLRDMDITDGHKCGRASRA